MSLPALKDLFARHRARATGQWRLGQELNRTVFLESGDIVFAASTHPLDRLTHLLVERGKITQAQLDYAMASLNPAMSIGKNLIEMGFITQRDLLDVARAQVERVVWASMANTDQAPVFDEKDLDATTVRLPFDTAAMLLSGVLNLVDRERVLEELGPLNQVVVLEGRRHQELSLPPDLAKLPAMLDGSRTLMELSRETAVEPFRLGAFVLFLREMGWARLHELPPLDRRALELALEPPEPAPTTPALPDPPPAPQPSLFAEIHASQHPTTNLEHLSEALDHLGPEDELEDPFPPAPEPEPQELPFTPSEPALPIHHDHHEAEGSTEPLDPDPAPASASAYAAASSGAAKAPRLALVLVAVLALAAGSWAGIGWLRRHRSTPSPKAPDTAPLIKPSPKPVVAVQPPPPQPAPEPEKKPEADVKADVKPEAKPAAKPEPPKPEPPKPEPPAAPSRGERLQAIVQGDMKRALAQGSAQRKAIQGRWTLRLEIACQANTVQHAAELLKAQDPDLFLVPMAMRDGRTCYQIYFGSYGSEAAAKAAAKRLPSPFLAEGNRPKPFRAAQIPDRQ